MRDFDTLAKVKIKPNKNEIGRSEKREGGGDGEEEGRERTLPTFGTFFTGLRFSCWA